MKKPKIELSLDSHNHLAQKMTERAAIAGPLHPLVGALLVYSVPQLSTKIWPYLVIMGLVFSAALRFIIARFVREMLPHPVTRRLWRMSFAFSSLLLAAGWAAFACVLLLTTGLNVYSIAAILAAAAIVAAAVPSFSYDLPLLLAFVHLTIDPIAFTGLFVEDMSALFPGLMLYSFFMTYISINMHRFEFTTMHQVEVIQEQKTRLEKLHTTVTTMVESLDEAFLLIDDQGLFRRTESKRALELFGRDPSGLHIHELLQQNEEDKALTAQWLTVCFGSEMDFKDLSALGPTGFHDSERGIDVALRYRPMYGREGRLESIVMLAKDVSREMEAERNAKANVARADMIIQALRNPAAFREFIQTADTVIHRMVRGIYRPGNELRHDLHTLKGGAMMFRVESVAEQIHEVEKKLREDGERANVRRLGSEMAAFFDGWKTVEDEFIQLLTKVTGNRKTKRTLQSYLESFSAAVNAAAKELGKSVRFEVIPAPDDEQITLAGKIPPVLTTLIHLFNNAVDHGMADPEVREERGKPQHGRITVRTEQIHRRGSRFVRILVSDDGEGIDAQGLRLALVRRGHSHPPEEPMKLFQHIFDDGLSSREEITRVSGHGVGLGAIRSAAEECGGTIRVVKSDSQGTDIEVIIPSHVFDSKDAAA